ncbi:MAG: phytanoyl-CoA dioxygenase family protein [Chitinophagales bacterium]
MKLLTGLNLICQLLAKKPNSTHKVGLHQDWTSYVDEETFRSFNVWVALCDTGRDNGGLNVLPKKPFVAASYSLYSFSNNLKPYESIIRWKSTLINTSLGLCCII